MAKESDSESGSASSSARFEVLLSALKDASLLTQDESCIWIRSKIGIIGMVTVDGPFSAETLQRQLDDKIAHAHSTLEELMSDKLVVDDIWNLILFIAVPWTATEIAKSRAIAAILARVARNLQGSRKIILYQGMSPATFVGPFNEVQRTWNPTIGDPLRDEIESVAKTNAEREALQVLFKRRITEDALDSLIEILGKKPNT